MLRVRNFRDHVWQAWGEKTMRQRLLNGTLAGAFAALFYLVAATA